MNVKSSLNILLIILASATMVFSCGKSKESEEKQAQQIDSTLQAAIAKAPFNDILEKAGFTIVGIKKFPTAEARRSGQTVVYRSTSKDPSGGVLYFSNERKRSFPTWHWYFDDVAPDSVTAVELNEDGMWDIRISMSDGSEREFLQGEEFTLFAESRSDWLALNGTSSSSTDPDHLAWKCLDGHLNTNWSSSMHSSGEVFLEVMAPFSIRNGIMTVHTVEDGRPRECELFADGKMIKQFTLEDQAGEQKVRLGADYSSVEKIRFVVRSTYDEGGNVNIAEFKLE
jgi:hypothetical protein